MERWLQEPECPLVAKLTIPLVMAFNYLHPHDDQVCSAVRTSECSTLRLFNYRQAASSVRRKSRISDLALALE